MGRMAALLLPLCVAISPVFAADPPAAISVDDTSPLLTYDNINHWTTHVNTPARFNLYSNSDTFSDVRGAWVSFTFNGQRFFFAVVKVEIKLCWWFFRDFHRVLGESGLILIARSTLL